MPLFSRKYIVLQNGIVLETNEINTYTLKAEILLTYGSSVIPSHHTIRVDGIVFKINCNAEPTD